jgi:prefoldin subunit 5
VGGVLVEYTISETINSLKQNIAMLEQALKALDAEMSKREKEVLEIELKYNLNPNKKQDQI